MTDLRSIKKDSREWAESLVGGKARLQVVVLLAAVLALDTADKAAVSAMAGQIKQAFHIGNTQIGFLVSVTSFVGVVGTLPFGLLVDRTRRVRILYTTIALWSVATVVCGTATSYLYLILTRLFLGSVTAAAVPAVASLTGDYFPAAERARIYGMILTGELIGTGFGFLLAEEVSVLLSWRWAFASLALPGGILAWCLRRYLPEPARGGQSWIEVGQEDIRSKDHARGRHQKRQTQRQAGSQAQLARSIVEQKHVEPDKDLILKQNPKNRSLWWAVKYVLSIKTNRYLIAASALGYYFFSGIRAFTMIYMTEHYGVGRSQAGPLLLVPGIAAVGGAIGGGRLADHLLRKGRIDARITVAGAALFISAVFFAPGLWLTAIAPALAFISAASGSLAAANAPLDAARLDIMHPALWGRAESVRISLRMFLEGSAPAVFGYLSDHVFGGGGKGLQWTFLVMLIPVVGASSLALLARRTYPRDVATAAASSKAIESEEKSKK